MSVVFESTIKMVEGSRENWYISLRDVIGEETYVCSDLQEYSKKIEELGKAYGGHVDEVRWSKDLNVHPVVIDTIRFEMSKLQREIEEEIGEPLIDEKAK